MTPSNPSPDTGAGTPPECHSTRSGDALLDTYAIETATCCGLTFEAHDETVTDHVVTSTRLWNAQLHDMVDNIERQARSRPATDPAGLDVDAAVNTLMRAGFKSVVQARSVVIPMLAAALTGERHDLDDEFLTPEQRRRLARLSVADGPGPEETDPLFRAPTIDKDADPPVAPPRPLAGSGHTDHPGRSARDAVVDRRPASVADGPGPEERPDLEAAARDFLKRWDDPERYHRVPAVEALRAALPVEETGRS